MPPGHHSRDTQDTFFVDDDRLLRTHTSPVQIRSMLIRGAPQRVIVPGKAFRRDYDATHFPMFFQVEGMCIDEGIALSDLKGTLEFFARSTFGVDRAIRLRPHHFEFTEPSVELDVSCAVCGGEGCRLCKGSGWLEVLGGGMIHPNVLRNGGVDPSAVQRVRVRDRASSASPCSATASRTAASSTRTTCASWARDEGLARLAARVRGARRAARHPGAGARRHRHRGRARRCAGPPGWSWRACVNLEPVPESTRGVQFADIDIGAGRAGPRAHRRAQPRSRRPGALRAAGHAAARAGTSRSVFGPCSAASTSHRECCARPPSSASARTPRGIHHLDRGLARPAAARGAGARHRARGRGDHQPARLPVPRGHRPRDGRRGGGDGARARPDHPRRPAQRGQHGAARRGRRRGPAGLPALLGADHRERRGGARRRTGCSAACARSACAPSTTSSTSPTTWPTSWVSRCTASTSTASSPRRGTAPRGARVVVRRGRGERLLCLDGVERTIGADDMAVCAGDVAVSLGGVIGGAGDRGRRRHPQRAPRGGHLGRARPSAATSKRLGRAHRRVALNEKGLSDTLPPLALDRAAALIADLGGGHVLKDSVDVRARPLRPIPPIAVSGATLSAQLGYHVDATEAATALARLGFGVEQHGDELTVDRAPLPPRRRHRRGRRRGGGPIARLRPRAQHAARAGARR